MYRYKLLNPDLTTFGGCPWTDPNGKFITVAAKGEGKRLCSEHVIHFYDHPVLAVLLNPLHAKIKDPILARIRTTREVNHDGLKGGCKAAKIVSLLPLPVVLEDQKAELAIRVIKKSYKEPTWNKWADHWLRNAKTVGQSTAGFEQCPEEDSRWLFCRRSGAVALVPSYADAYIFTDEIVMGAHAAYIAATTISNFDYAIDAIDHAAFAAGGKISEFRKTLISILKEMSLFKFAEVQV